MGQVHDLQAFFQRQASLGQSTRELIAGKAERYYLGKQYDEGFKKWDDLSVPLRERKPLVLVPLYKEAVDSIARFVWGGHRFPEPIVPATVTADGKKSEIGPHLDKDQAAEITKFLRTVIKDGHLQRVVKEMTRKAITTTSAAVLLVVRSGYLTARVEEGKHCTPEFDKERPDRLSKLTIQYQFARDEETSPGIYREKLYWFRRVIDTERDVTYKEVPVVVGRPPEWVEDPEKTFDHMLGIVPAQWFRTLPDSTDAIDGTPVIDPQLYPLLDDVNYTISQRSRSIKYVTDPQVIRKGVNEKDRAAMNKAPGMPWDVPPEGGVELLELSGSGAEAATHHAKDLIEHFRAAVAYVKANPETTSGNISGVVLEFLHAPMISLAADLRDDLGSNGYCSLLAIALEMLCIIAKRGEMVFVPGFNEACKIIEKAQAQGPWLRPRIELEWAPFFAETAMDKQAKVTYTQQAKDAGLVAPQTAITHVSSIFNVADAEAEQDQIEEANAEKLAQQAETMKLQASLKRGGEEPAKPGEAPPASAKPKSSDA